ncbi:MAG: hypothetical protein WD267_10860 [Balneolales bacterium]
MYRLSVLFIIFSWIAIGCSDDVKVSSDVEIKSISKDNQSCDFCQKKIKNARYGGIITTSTGEELQFRSIECVAGYIVSKELKSTDDVRVVNFIDAKTLLKVEDAIYLQSPNLGSPNGLDFAAIERKNVAMQEKIERVYPGQYLDWNEVMNRVIHSGYALNH